MSFIIIFLFLHIFISNLCMITTLPVTSKPIENTPEHLAWEAWVLVPSSHDKSRKITPKSIFIVPNATNSVSGFNGDVKGSQIQCPPGHTADDLKCIPTVSIDQSQILITRLTNLVQPTDRNNGSIDDVNDTYDYDYEYDMYEADQTQAFASNGVGNIKKNGSVLLSSVDYDDEPLKINLSLEKFPSFNRKIEGSMRINESKNVSTVKPLLEKEKTLRDMTTQPILSRTMHSADKKNILVTISTIETIDTTMLPSKTDSSISDKSVNIIPLLSPSEKELLATVTVNTNSTTIKGLLDFDLDDKSAIRSTTENEIEVITNIDKIQNITLKDEIKKDSLIVGEINLKSTTDVSETTEVDDQIFTTILNEAIEIGINLTPKSTENLTRSIKQNSFMKRNQTVHFNDKFKTSESSEIRNDATELIKTIENDNRSLYHYLAAINSTPNTEPRLQIETTTQIDIREQLRIINQIVQENKIRSAAMKQLGPTRHLTESKIIFPEDQAKHSNSNHNRYENVRLDFEKFPKDTLMSPLRLISMSVHHDPSLNSYYHSDKFFPTPSQQQPQTVHLNNNSKNQEHLKPFWWLPTGWEMANFWSRIPVDELGNLYNRHQMLTLPPSVISTTTTASTNRENSRSPTENLFKQEMLTQQQQHQYQDTYHNLKAKQWKHKNR